MVQVEVFGSQTFGRAIWVGASSPLVIPQSDPQSGIRYVWNVRPSRRVLLRLDWVAVRELKQSGLFLQSIKCDGFCNRIYVYPDPLTAQLLSRNTRGRAPAEWVKNKNAFGSGRFNDPSVQAGRLLRLPLRFLWFVFKPFHILVNVI
ncbi:MAG: hypothetical protein OXG16_09040 [Rhodospirillales bacterium]|nr:hypothetical protein [Rhodospirillales bacterium]